MRNDLYLTFQNPTNAYRGKPFWSWNGKLKKEELLRQVHVMKEMGFGGFFMHSRTGLETEYLGEEWFDLINACADEGEKLGLEAWLYDEDRWPSGTAGGMVTKEPRFRMKSLQMKRVDPAMFEWTDELVAAFVAQVDGLVLDHYTPLFKDADCDFPPGSTVLTFTVNEMTKSSFYNGYTYVDTMNGEATQAYIDMTHEKYKEQCGPRLGRTIRGIFTDEPHRGRLMSSFGSSPGEESADLEYSVPWTYALFDEFNRKYGYDLIARLPELFLWYKGSYVSQVKWQFVELLQMLFQNHFLKPLGDWCKANNMILTGHALHEDSLTAQTAMAGSMMRLYEYLDYPGVDVLSEHNRCFWLAKQLSSAARQLGKRWLLSELYGCTGWQMPFESHKAVGDWQALFGINLRCHHLSWYTMKGESKRDYPASIFHQSAWWKEYKQVEDYFSRIGVVMSEGNALCETLVVNPIESVWCQVHPGWCKGLAANAPEIKKLEEHYVNVFHWLTEAHVDFDYGDEEMMSRLAVVASDRNGSPILKVGKASYRQVIVAGLTTIRSSTLSVLQQFVQAGGKVIFAGDLPPYVDALPSESVQMLAMKAMQVGFHHQAIVNACRQGLEQPVRIQDSVSGEDIRDLFVQVREDGQNRYMMLLNVNRNQTLHQVKITIQGDGYLQEWDCATGERYSAAKSSQGSSEFIVDFQPGGEKMYILTDREDPSLPAKAAYQEDSSKVIEGQFDYELDEPNVCVLDWAAYRIDHGEWQPAKEILKVDRDVRRNFGLELRAGNMTQPWYAKRTNPEGKGKVELSFDFHVGRMPDGEVELVMEQPEHFKVKLNGQVIDTRHPNGRWIDICFNRFLLPKDCLVPGKNTIELETDFQQAIDLEAIYLLGHFGVEVSGTDKTLTTLPDQLHIGDLTTQGLPFYSGKVTYRVPVKQRPENGKRLFLVLDEFAGACLKINPEEEDPTIMAWQPYEADITELVKKHGEVRLQVILTRRNTFGPLHQKPLFTHNYGPMNFITEGQAFTDDYMLVPSGLVSAPKISVRHEGNKGVQPWASEVQTAPM